MANRSRIPTLSRLIGSLGCALALLSGCASTPHGQAPTSNLPRQSALSLAHLTAASIGGQVFTIAPTGSMKPTLDETSIVTVEPTAFSDLREGDIVIYRTGSGMPVIHRLQRRLTNEKWFVQGDNNAHVDPEAVTSANFIGRVCAIFYTSEVVGVENRAFASPRVNNIPAESPKIH